MSQSICVSNFNQAVGDLVTQSVPLFIRSDFWASLSSSLPPDDNRVNGAPRWRERNSRVLSCSAAKESSLRFGAA